MRSIAQVTSNVPRHNLSRYFFSIDLEVRKSSTCKKFQQEEQELGVRRFWSFKVDIFDRYRTPNGSNRQVQNSKTVNPLGDSQGSFALRSVNGTVGARVVARCALRSPSSQFFRKEGRQEEPNWTQKRALGAQEMRSIDEVGNIKTSKQCKKVRDEYFSIIIYNIVVLQDIITQYAYINKKLSNK